MNHQEPRPERGVARPIEGLENAISDWVAGNILLMSIAAVVGVVVIMNCVVPMVVSRKPHQPVAKPGDFTTIAPPVPAVAPR